MAERRTSAGPAAGASRRPVVTVLVVVAAAVVGAAVVVALWPGRSSSPAAQPGASSAASAASPGTSTGSGAASACTGGADPVAAVQAAMSAPATPEGAAQAAAAVVRFTNSLAFGKPGAKDVIAKIADPSGAGGLVAEQEGQAPYLAQMTASAAHPSGGAYAVLPDPVAPTVTVLTPVDWSTTQAKHHDWYFLDVKLLRNGDRWTVVSEDDSPSVADSLQPIRRSDDAHAVNLDRYSDALAAQGFRRYSGDC